MCVPPANDVAGRLPYGRCGKPANLCLNSAVLSARRIIVTRLRLEVKPRLGVSSWATRTLLKEDLVEASGLEPLTFPKAFGTLSQLAIHRLVYQPLNPLPALLRLYLTLAGACLLPRVEALHAGKPPRCMASRARLRPGIVPPESFLDVLSLPYVEPTGSLAPQDVDEMHLRWWRLAGSNR